MILDIGFSDVMIGEVGIVVNEFAMMFFDVEGGFVEQDCCGTSE